MKRMLRGIARGCLDSTLIPAARYVQRNLLTSNVLRELDDRVSKECADFAVERMKTALHFEKADSLLDYAFSRATNPGLILEFGVWKGRSINRIAAKAEDRTVYGFDSFQGLEQDWSGSDLPKGYFDLKGRTPEVCGNVSLIKGWFSQTLPAFLNAHPEPFSFVHIDSDTYEAARDVLTLCSGRFLPGTVVVFDEYFGYRGWRLGEHKAWQECPAGLSGSYRFIGFSTKSVAMQLDPTV